MTDHSYDSVFVAAKIQKFVSAEECSQFFSLN